MTFCDNQSAFALSRSTVPMQRTKHMDLRFRIRDFVRDLCYCPTGHSRAGPLTKPLIGEKYICVFLAVGNGGDPSDHSDAFELSDDEPGYCSSRSYFVFLQETHRLRGGEC